MRSSWVLLACVVLVGLVAAKTFFRDDFGKDWRKNWVSSRNKEEDGTAGLWKYECGRFCAGDEEKGIRTAEDARFYQLASKIEPSFHSGGGDFVVTYTVKNEQLIDCAGYYLKLGPPGLDLREFNSDTDYNIMFGPDMCGSTRRIHFILNRNGKNHEIVEDRAHLGEPDRDTEKVHAYTFVIKADKSYAVYVDGMKRAEGGTIEEHWDLLAPKTIRDPDVSKPADWADEPEMPDPAARKPADWEQPAEIPKPAARKPDSWDEEVDGEWQAPMMKNPKYKGPWSPPMIENPDYQGPWVAPQIPNPDYAPDASLAEYEFGFVGLDLWQVKSGSIFTHIWIGDDLQEQLDWIRGDLREVREKESALQAEAAAKEAEESRRNMEAEDDYYEDDHDEF